MNRIKALSQGLVALHYDNPQEDYHKEQQFRSVMNKAFPNNIQPFYSKISGRGYYHNFKDMDGDWFISDQTDLISYPVETFIDDYLDNIIETLKGELKQPIPKEQAQEVKNWDWRGNMPSIVALVWLITYLLRLHFNPDVTGWFISSAAFAVSIIIGILCKKLLI